MLLTNTVTFGNHKLKGVQRKPNEAPFVDYEDTMIDFDFLPLIVFELLPLTSGIIQGIHKTIESVTPSPACARPYVMNESRHEYVPRFRKTKAQLTKRQRKTR